jgi:hypothetical protein
MVKNRPVKSLLAIMTPCGFRTVSLRLLFGICPATTAVPLLCSTRIANDIGRDVSVTCIDAFTDYIV